MVSTQVLHTDYCPTVDCFFKNIDELRIGQQDQTWIFRGQNRDWPLLPPSLRCDFIVQFVLPALNRIRDVLKQRKDRELDSCEHLRLYIYVQRRTEDLLVRRFAQVADRAHLYVPEDSNFALGGEYFKIDPEALEDAVSGNSEPFRAPVSVVDALAQHHRVPTRLLDFTFNPYVAAWFATDVGSEDEQKRYKQRHERMVIWAVNHTMLELEDSDLSLVVQPRTRIGFLQAQDGAFLFDKKADLDVLEYTRWVGFDEKLSRTSCASTCIKYKIPFSESSNLRRRLLQFGVSEPTLMPSFDVVRKWTLDQYAKHPESLFWVPQ